MLALSIQQPWAWLIVNGYKAIENRGWYTSFRGRFLIHTGQKFDHDGYRYIQHYWPEIPLPAVSDFKRGGIVGEARLTDCVTKSDSAWFFGKFGFVLEDVRPLPFRAWRGRLGFFEVELPAPTEATPDADS